MHLQPDRALIPANTPAVRYLHVLISAPSQPKAAGAVRTPVDIALVLDRSGSMDGNKLTMAREAVTHAIRLLKPDDHLGVVCYDEQVTTVLDRTPATPEAKTLATKRLKSIDARGSTDLHGGWLRGAELARAQEPRGDALSKVLLLTDGLANHGVIDHGEMLASASRLRREGIITSTFGVGADFDEELLSRLATEGGGHFYFIENARQIPDLFASELGDTLEVVAREVVFEVSCDPGVEATILNALPSEQAAGRLRVQCGDLVADQELVLIVAIAFTGAHPEGTVSGVKCRLSDREHVLFAEPAPVPWLSVAAGQDAAQPVNRAVRLAVAAMLAERARSTALAANRRGDFDVARRILREMVDDLRAMAPGDKGVLALIDQLHHDELAFGEIMTPLAMKGRHFDAYRIAHSRAEGGTARRKKRPEE
ncbi:MAG: VWA domain-containing protein [Acidobacteriota bacterium]|nr:VWA domain-containing protein [Acidobacteriota bacterium]